MKCIFANSECNDIIKYRMPLAASEKAAAICEYHWTLRKDDVRLAAENKCTCWEGYERVPGTKPCAAGSCRKKSSFDNSEIKSAKTEEDEAGDQEEDEDEPYEEGPYGEYYCDRPECNCRKLDIPHEL